MTDEQRRLLSETLARNVEDMLDGMDGIDKADIEHVRQRTLDAFEKALGEALDTVRCPSCGSDETELVPGPVIKSINGDVYLSDTRRCGQCGLNWKWEE
jgi:hypothetical protein